MRRVYAERREALLEAIARHADGWLEPIASEAGLHLAARLRTRERPAALVARSREHGVAVEALGRYAAGTPAVNGLAFGYGMIRAERIDEAMRQLARLAATAERTR